MPNVARITDMATGVCCCHDGCTGMIGFIITGASTISTEGEQNARIGDIVLGACGHIGVIVSGATTRTDEYSPLARIGDAVTGCLIMTIVTGANTVTCE